MTGLKRMYDWILKWAELPYGSLALFILAFAVELKEVSPAGVRCLMYFDG